MDLLLAAAVAATALSAAVEESAKADFANP
jgi:hypothetical protein